MFQLVDDYRNSGSTIKSFCEDRGIKIGTFSYWIKKKKELSSEGGFVKIQTPNLSNTGMELIYPNGVRLRTNPQDLGLVKKLLELY